MAELDEQLSRWTRAGLLTSDQAAAIAAFERRGPRGERTSLLAEVLGYIGGSLALVAAIVAVAGSWEDLASTSRIGIAAIATVALLAAGAWARTSEQPAVGRLTTFLWFLSAGAMAFLARLVVGDVLEMEGRGALLTIAGVTAVYAGALWIVRPTSLQQVAAFASLTVVVISSLSDPGVADGAVAATLVWGLGLVWGALSWRSIVRPPAVGFALGALAMLGGAQVLAFDEYRGLGLALGIGTAIAFAVASLATGAGVLLGFAAVGVFLFVPQVVFQYFSDELGAPLALFITGLAILLAGVVIARLRRELKESPFAPPVERASSSDMPE